MNGTENRADFDDLMSRVTELMTNIVQFEKSVSLVVTKVPFYVNGSELTEDSFKNSTTHLRSIIARMPNEENPMQLVFK